MSEKSSFERLAAVNVNDHIEKKNNLSYLSWAWALDQLMRQDPEATWEYAEPKMFGDTMMVYCTVTAFGKARTAHLPVMDYKNKPIPNPDAFAVNTAMQRCFVKAIAMHGLGLYIYAGEDLPLGEEVQPVKITPAAGAVDRLGAGRKESLDRLVADCTTLLVDGDIQKAFSIIQNIEDADEKVYAWSQFDSKSRTAMKKHAESLKPEKKAA